MVVTTDKTIDEHIREELSDFPESEEKEDAISLAIQMVENENYTVGEAAREVSIELKQSLEKSNQLNIEKDRHKYMMLSRLKSDCLYFLGNGCGSEKRLWALAVENQILEMKKLWNEIVVKPEWLTLEEIDDFKKQMCILKLEIEKDNPDFINQNNIHFYYEFMGDDDIRKSSCEAEEFVKSLATPSREISLKIIDIDYDEGLDFDDVLSQIPMITTDNDVVTDGRIVRYTVTLNTNRSVSVFYDEVTSEYAYDVRDITEEEIEICDEIGIELKKSNGNYETLAKRLTAVEVDKDVFENMSTVKTLSDELVKKSLSEKFGASFMGGVDLVMWDRTVLENRDYKRVGIINNGVATLSPDYQDDYDAKLYAECMGATSFYNKERSIHDIAQSYNSEEHGKIEDILASNVPVKNLEV